MYVCVYIYFLCSFLFIHSFIHLSILLFVHLFIYNALLPVAVISRPNDLPVEGQIYVNLENSYKLGYPSIELWIISNHICHPSANLLNRSPAFPIFGQSRSRGLFLAFRQTFRQTSSGIFDHLATQLHEPGQMAPGPWGAFKNSNIWRVAKGEMNQGIP